MNLFFCSFFLQSFHPASTGYFCKCPASFMGSHCEVVLSPCASNPCLYGGTCVPRADDFYCQCRGQYSGQRYCFHICQGFGRHTRAHHPVPYSGLTNCTAPFSISSAECEWPLFLQSLNSMCLSFRCQVGPYCQDNPCKNRGNCIPGLDGPVCECEAGFQGDRYAKS